MSHPLPIVVITPVKNEEWILERFLAVTSHFASRIIIADQQSTDTSREICRRYEKVVLIENNILNYDEASRQLLLLTKAREVLAGPKVILALDADEILAANAMGTVGWHTMLTSKPGTVLRFEKPDLYLSPYQCLRWRDNPHPIGFIDDGSKHQPRAIHSIRIPQPENAPQRVIHDVKVLHYGMANLTLQRAKMRYYSVIENVMRVNNGVKRRGAYCRAWIEQFAEKAEPSDVEWFRDWERRGIDMRSIAQSEFPWHDFEILRHFKAYGYRKFDWDDIWNVNWEQRRQYGNMRGFPEMPISPVRSPSHVDQWWRDRVAAGYQTASKLYHF